MPQDNRLLIAIGAGLAIVAAVVIALVFSGGRDRNAEPPPAAQGTISFTGRAGHAWAKDVAGASAAPRRIRSNAEMDRSTGVPSQKRGNGRRHSDRRPEPVNECCEPLPGPFRRREPRRPAAYSMPSRR